MLFFSNRDRIRYDILVEDMTLNFVINSAKNESTVNVSAFIAQIILPTTTFHRLIPLINSLPVVPRQWRLFPFLEVLCFQRAGALTQHIIHTLVKETTFENVCHFRTRVSAIATHFLQAVFLTVHFMIMLCQRPFHVSWQNELQKLKKFTAIDIDTHLI